MDVIGFTISQADIDKASRRFEFATWLVSQGASWTTARKIAHWAVQ